MNLALFDLDNTLLACDSDYEWGQFLVDRGVLDRADYEAQNAAFYEQYKAGTLDIHEFLGFALRPLAEHTPEDLARWHAEFMAARIRPAMGPASQGAGAPAPGRGRPVRRGHRHQQLRDRADRARVRRPAPGRDRARAGGGRFTGRVAGTPCFREGKIAPRRRLARRPGARAEGLFRKAASTATRTTTCRCWSACRARWPWIRTTGSPPRRRAGAGR